MNFLILDFPVSITLLSCTSKEAEPSSQSRRKEGPQTRSVREPLARPSHRRGTTGAATLRPRSEQISRHREPLHPSDESLEVPDGYPRKGGH